MARSDKAAGRTGLSCTAADIARLRNGGVLPAGARKAGTVGSSVSLAQSNRLKRQDGRAFAFKVGLCLVLLTVLVFLSLGIMGAQGRYYPYAGAYALYSPIDVFRALGEHLYNGIAALTHALPIHSNEWILANVPGYWGIARRGGVIGITLICAVLLSVSGMLYQNAFKNPIAGPGMLGVSSGVSLGLMVLVYLFGAAAPSMVGLRYGLCYLFGAAILVFVIAAGRRLSRDGRPFDVVTMLLLGSVLSQLLGFAVSYVTLFVMDESDYLVFYTLSQMLTVETSGLSWAVLIAAACASFVPVWLLRGRLGALMLGDQEARSLGVDAAKMRAVALICGAIMILAAQIHVGTVALVSLVVPFLSRQLFGCSMGKQLAGNVCLGTLLLLLCRDICDLIPFVGDGLSVGSVVSVAALPLFVAVMAKALRGWK